MAYVYLSKRTPEVRIENHGSVFIFQPMTITAREWLIEKCEPEAWQWWGGGLAVEPRYALDLARGLTDEGFEVE